MSKRVLIVGQPPLIGDIAALCHKAKFKEVSVFDVDDLDEQEILDEMVQAAVRCDVFIESLNDTPANKLWLIEGVEINLKDDALLLTHPLCVSATEVASWCTQPERVIGYGLLPPLDEDMRMVEFAPALQADHQRAAAAREMWTRLGFEAVRVPDAPGLVRARIVCNLINEASFALDQKIARAEDIDKALKHGAGYPRGPLAWADEIGLDVVLGTLIGLQNFYGDDRYRPSPLLKQKVWAGQLGKRVGRGFFDDPIVVPSTLA